MTKTRTTLIALAILTASAGLSGPAAAAPIGALVEDRAALVQPALVTAPALFTGEAAAPVTEARFRHRGFRGRSFGFRRGFGHRKGFGFRRGLGVRKKFGFGGSKFIGGGFGKKKVFGAPVIIIK
ncbi:MAG: hypothetical protein AAF713_04785 [Pseudomonadota bacterium]